MKKLKKYIMLFFLILAIPPAFFIVCMVIQSKSMLEVIIYPCEFAKYKYYCFNSNKSYNSGDTQLMRYGLKHAPEIMKHNDSITVQIHVAEGIIIPPVMSRYIFPLSWRYPKEITLVATDSITEKKIYEVQV